MKINFFLVVPIALLVGCAQYLWFKDGAGQSEFNVDSHECQQEAARTYPPAFVTQSYGSGYQAPSTTNCVSTGYGSVNCTTTPGVYTPPATSQYDANLGNRRKAALSCLTARGWERRRVN